MSEKKIIARYWRPPFSVRFAEGTEFSATIEGDYIYLKISECDPLRIKKDEFLSNNHDFIIVRSSGTNMVTGDDGKNSWLYDSMILLGGKTGFVIRRSKHQTEVKKIKFFRDLGSEQFWVDDFFTLDDRLIYMYEDGIVVFFSSFVVENHIRRTGGDGIVNTGILRKKMILESKDGERKCLIAEGSIGEKVTKVEIYDE